MRDIDSYSEYSINKNASSHATKMPSTIPFVWVCKEYKKWEYDGIIEIRFKVGISNHIHWLNLGSFLIPSFLGVSLTTVIANYKELLQTKFFDSKTGKCISEIEKEAIKMEEQAESLVKKDDLKAAVELFQKAYDKSNDSVIKTRLKNSLDSTKFAQQNNESYQKMKEKEQVERENQRLEKERLDRENLLREEKEKEVEKNYLEVFSSWTEAWRLEENEQSEKAYEKFKETKSKLMRFLANSPENHKLNQLNSIVNLKIDGNELFNQGADLQKEANRLMSEANEFVQKHQIGQAMAKYKEALDKYNNAKNKFEQGRKSDEKFAACLEFINDVIEDISITIQILNENTLSDSDFLQTFSNLNYNLRDSNTLDQENKEEKRNDLFYMFN